MSSRVLKQQLSALTREKTQDKELGPKKKELKARRKTKAKTTAPSEIAQEQPKQAGKLSQKAKAEILKRNLQYLAAEDSSEHADNARQKMQQVLTSSS